MQTELILCECNSLDHQMIIIQDPEEEDFVFLEVHLSNKNFLSRVKYAIRYIFGYKSRFGAWDEFILHKDKLKNLCKTK